MARHHPTSQYNKEKKINNHEAMATAAKDISHCIELKRLLHQSDAVFTVWNSISILYTKFSIKSEIYFQKG